MSATDETSHDEMSVLKDVAPVNIRDIEVTDNTFQVLKSPLNWSAE